MPRIAAIDRISDARAARKKKRERARARKDGQRRARRRIVAKALVCLVLLATFLGLGFLVGNADYEVTLVGWAPFLMTLVGIALAGFHALALRRGVAFEERLLASECERDSEVSFTVRFRNATPLLATRCVATFYIADMFDNVANEMSTTLSLSPFEDTELSFATKFEHIGSYHAGLDRVEITDFLGLFIFTVANNSRQVVHVTPKLVELDGIRFSNEAMDEATKAAKSVLADSMDYAYVREYELGDPLKTIHWKLSARAGDYMTRLFEVYSNPSVVVVMDFFGPSDEATELMGMFDAVVESAFSLARYARSQGMDVEVHYRSRNGDEQVVREIDGGKVSEMVADLPRMSNDPADAAGALDILEGQIAAPRGFNNIFVCTANVGADMVSAVVEAKLRRRTPTMVAVVPTGLLGREREDYCKSLARLEDDGIAYAIVARSEELSALGGD